MGDAFIDFLIREKIVTNINHNYIQKNNFAIKKEIESVLGYIGDFKN